MCGQTNIGSFAIETFGCKLNQYESELIRERFIKRGWVEVDFNDKADVYVINTCTVTQKSDARGRNAVRRARRNNPAAMIIVTGCSIETKQDSVLKMSEIDFSIGNKGKTMIPEIAELLLRGEQVDKDRLQLTSDINSHMMIESFFEHARAFIKVQEGCNFSCSYCIIPKARGRSRSVEARHVVDQVKLLREKGYHEVVLTGIHIGRYGLDFEKKMRLSDLIEMILDIPGFNGEVIVAENHQKSTPYSRGWTKNNVINGDPEANNMGQLIELFRTRGYSNVTKYHWLNTENGGKVVAGPWDGDGYVRTDPVYEFDGRKTLMTYPVFTSSFSGVTIDLKNGAWKNGKYIDRKGSSDSD